MASATTLEETTLEGQALEVIRELSAHQANTATNPDARTVITSPLTINGSTGLASVTLQIPITLLEGTGGKLVVGAVEVFVDPV